MTNGNPSTPVKVPPSATSYTPATLDPDLRSQINTLLIRDGHVAKIQEHLLHSLHAHSTNWPTAVQKHALDLLRSGEATTFTTLIDRVLSDIRQHTLNPKLTSTSTPTSSQTSTPITKPAAMTTTAMTATANGADVNGNSAKKDSKLVNGEINGGGADESQAGGGDDDATSNVGINLAVPQAVVEEALRVTRESLEMVCGIEADGPT